MVGIEQPLVHGMFIMICFPTVSGPDACRIRLAVLSVLAGPLAKRRAPWEPNIEFSCAAASTCTEWNSELLLLTQAAFKATTATICYVTCLAKPMIALAKTGSYAIAFSLAFVLVKSNASGLKFGPISFWTSR